MKRRDILKGTGLFAAGAAAGVMSPFNKDVNVTASMGGIQVPVPANDMPLKPDTAERDYRWKRTRELLKSKGLNAVIIPTTTYGEQPNFGQHISNSKFMRASAIIFPLEGEPVGYGNMVMPFDGSWIVPKDEDRLLTPAQLIAKYIKEYDLADGKIGTAGVMNSDFGYHEFRPNGYMAYPVWKEVLDTFPNTEFVDITSEFAQMITARSPADIEVQRQAALIGESLHEYILDFTKVGMSDREFKANIDYFFALNNTISDVKAPMIMPGLIKDGDLINSEYGIVYNGGYAQVTLCFSMGKPSSDVMKMRDVAKASVDKSLELMKPGVTFGSVIDEITKIVKDAGYWHMFPQIHGLNPITFVGEIGNTPDEIQPTRGHDIVLQEGMTFSLENAAIARGLIPNPLNQVKLGGTCVITKTGVEVFNTLGLDLQVI